MGHSPEEREPVTIEDVTCVKDTGKALLIVDESGGEHWIPSKLVHDDSEVYDDKDNYKGKLVIPTWLAEEKGLL